MRIAIVLKGYPRLSETFIAQEILALQQAGLDLTICSLRHPTDSRTHPVHEAISAPVLYLPEYLYREPVRVFRAWLHQRRNPRYRETRNTWWRDLQRDRDPNRIRRFGQALVLASELPPEVTLLYAHFLHTPASVARYAALLRQLPWSCSAHAKDIWTIPEWEKREKLESCNWLTTCTRANVDHLRSLSADRNKVQLNYHGIDLARFDGSRRQYSNRDGSDPNEPVRLLSVGRLVSKKGYGGLLQSLATLPQELHWRLVHIGGGPLAADLESSATKLGIADRIRWLGACDQTVVLQQYGEADLFVLNCRVDPGGDRDGLPNVLVEAQGQGLPVISTAISGIPELLEDGVNGLMVEAENVQALAAAIEKLATSPQQRERLGIRGREIVHTRFDSGKNFEQLFRTIAGEGETMDKDASTG